MRKSEKGKEKKEKGEGYTSRPISRRPTKIRPVASRKDGSGRAEREGKRNIPMHRAP